MDILDRRLNQMKQQGHYPDTYNANNYSVQTEGKDERYDDFEDRLESGQEFGGVRRKDMVFKSAAQQRETERQMQTHISSKSRQGNEDSLRQEMESEEEKDFDYSREARKRLTFHKDDSKREITDYGYAGIGGKTPIQVDRPTAMTKHEPDYIHAYLEGEAKPELYLQKALQKFELQFMNKVSNELKLQNQQMFLEQQRKIEESLVS